MLDEPDVNLRCQTGRQEEGNNAVGISVTVGRWIWKSSPSKQSVTTDLPRKPARKMDGAQAIDRYLTASLERSLGRIRLVSRGASGYDFEIVRVSSCGVAWSADLGGSSKYSNESFED